MFITFDEFDKKYDFFKFVVTTKEVDGKSREDMQSVCKKAGLNINNLTSNIQIHSDIVNTIDKNTISTKKEGDSLITNLKEVPLLVFTADCVPISLIDTKNKAIGLIHAGWRGTYEEISKKTIEVMKNKYNSKEEDLIAIIGPSIGPCCYEVSKDLVEKFSEKFINLDENFYKIDNKKYMLDLWKINEYILKSCNVTEIINLNLCTVCNNDKFYSYRKDNKTTKRIATLLQLI